MAAEAGHQEFDAATGVIHENFHNPEGRIGVFVLGRVRWASVCFSGSSGVGERHDASGRMVESQHARDDKRGIPESGWMRHFGRLYHRSDPAGRRPAAIHAADGLRYWSGSLADS
ncbi:hypothetical protein [Brevundimonas diminuta]|uniref:hypothetical protein n=1 Tax=Brevundimonas diminuta TaxID=293 RepID=UPI0028AD44E0|nr:hypothetical protein [Brevundimonas diminuta]